MAKPELVRTNVRCAYIECDALGLPTVTPMVYPSPDYSEYQTLISAGELTDEGMTQPPNVRLYIPIFPSEKYELFMKRVWDVGQEKLQNVMYSAVNNLHKVVVVSTSAGTPLGEFYKIHRRRFDSATKCPESFVSFRNRVVRDVAESTKNDDTVKVFKPPHTERNMAVTRAIVVMRPREKLPSNSNGSGRGV